MKKIKKPTKKKLIKIADALWSEKVKKLAGYKCEYSGQTEHLNSHHVYSRSNHSVRWDVRNGVCLTVGHHVFSSVFSAHKTPIEFIEWIKGVRGEEWYNDLRKRAAQVKQYTVQELQEVINELKKL